MIRNRAQLLLLAALALGLGGCGLFGRGPQYPLSREQALEKLHHADAPLGILGSSAVDWRMSDLDENTVAWTVIDDKDRPMLRFTAAVTAVDGGVRVATDVIPVSGTYEGSVRKGLDEHPEVRTLYRAAIAEQVAATLESRKFNFSHIAAETAAATIAALPRIRAKMDKDSEDSARHDRDNIERAYRREAGGN